MAVTKVSSGGIGIVLDREGEEMIGFIGVGVLGSYDLTHRWTLVGSIESRRLSDEAAKSPIVERRSGVYASVGIAYRF